MEGVNSLLARP